MDYLVLPFCLLPSAACAYTDFRFQRIYNKITLPMLVSGLVYSAVTGNIINSLLGMAAGFGIVLVCVLMGGAGAGDAKLAGALGAWLGLNVVGVLLLASFLGVAWGCWKLIKLGNFKRWLIAMLRGVFYRAVYGMKGVIPMGKLPEDLDAPAPPEAVPFGVCLAAAAWIVWGVLAWKM